MTERNPNANESKNKLIYFKLGYASVVSTDEV